MTDARKCESCEPDSIALGYSDINNDSGGGRDIHTHVRANANHLMTDAPKRSKLQLSRWTALFLCHRTIYSNPYVKLYTSAKKKSHSSHSLEEGFLDSPFCEIPVKLFHGVRK